LDDLIVGAQNVSLGGKSNAGRSYVIFGKKTVQQSIYLLLAQGALSLTARARTV
jgi:hypothetical protein